LEALTDSPVVLIHGPRQSGKTTLARIVGEPRGYAYRSFDDDVHREAAENDPAGFVDDLPEKVTLDEVQRVPSLFTALKASIDRRRVPGRFILTGSANVLLVPKLADSLAGRMAILRLHPLSQAELEGTASRFLDTLFSGSFKTRRMDRLREELVTRVVSGGYPAALARSPKKRRATWYRDYLEAIVQRDVKELSRIHSLQAIPRLLALTAAHTAQLLNVSDLSGSFQLSRPTIAAYVTLLERVFLLDTLPPWHSNRVSRLIKSPKLHLGDTGLACALLGVNADDLVQDRPLLGHLLETFVFQELKREASGHQDPHAFFHFRDRDGAEVDIVIERGTRAVAGVEIKAGATVRGGDFRGMRKLKEAAGKRFVAGVVLYDGETPARFGEGMYAVPLRRLWSPGLSN
jgi:hypothetical protein